jgi:hypothetical protein
MKIILCAAIACLLASWVIAQEEAIENNYDPSTIQVSR